MAKEIRVHYREFKNKYSNFKHYDYDAKTKMITVELPDDYTEEVEQPKVADVTSLSGVKKVADSKYTYLEFDSISSSVRYIEKVKVNSCFEHDMHSVKGNYKFTKTYSWEESLDLLLHGWEHGAREIKKELDAKVIHHSTTQRNIYDVAGFQCSVPRYLNGVPTTMINKKNVPQKDKIVNVYKDISYHCGFTTKQIIKESVKVLQMVNRLEKNGYRVNLNIVWGVYDKDFGKNLVTVVPVKKSSARLNIKQLAYPMCHPSMLRRTAFAIIERVEEHNNDYMCRTYGRALVASDTANILVKHNKSKSYLLPAVIEGDEILDPEKYAI